MFTNKKIIKKYREKLKKIKNKYDLRQRNEKNKFISILNHDIKSPILAQNQSLELLLGEKFGKLNKLEKEVVQEIKNSNNFLLEVVLNAIFLTKYENDNPKLNIEKINVLEQIKDCCELIKNQAIEKSQNIIIKTNKINEIKLDADRKLIQKIILNIISTSIASGFENSDIEILVKENSNSISFITKNKSVYMTKEKIKSLFEEKNSQKDFNQLGVNLNLNIAKKLITAHNWDIVAKSREDNSTIFGFVVKK